MADMPKPREERILVCVSRSPSSAQLIDAASKMATSLHAKWWAAHVEEPKMALLPEAERSRAADNLKLAGRLGAETVTLVGRNVAEEIVDFATQRNVTRIIVGKPARPSWRGIFSRSPVDRVVRISRDIDVYVTTGEPGEQREPAYVIRPKRIHLSDYGAGFLHLVLATAICFVMFPYFHLANLIMVYLMAVMITATTCGRGPAVLTSLLSVLAFDFFFVPPRFSFTVDESEYIVTFVVMALVALVISHLAAGMRQQSAIARLQEREAAAMHGLSRQLASARGVERILRLAVQYISEIFDCEVSALLPDETGKLKVAAGDLSSVIQKGVMKEIAVANAAYGSGQMAGWGTQTSPTTDNLYVPLRAGATTWGILALRPRDPGRFLLREQLTLLDSLAKQVALALEVERMSVHALTAVPKKGF
jgi:two-component system, OmpR family, sensor histidine kinase KdpD